MQITMLHTRRGSENGFTVKEYEKGVTYDVARSLATRFLREGQAYCAEDEPPVNQPSPSPFGFRFPDPTPEQVTANTPIPSAIETILGTIAGSQAEFNRIFRPEASRPQNPATLMATGKLGAPISEDGKESLFIALSFVCGVIITLLVTMK